MDKEILTIKEFAEKISYSERWVRQMCIDGKIEGDKISDDARKWLIPASELIRLKASIISDMFNESAIKLVADNLRIAYYKGSKNLQARHNMAIAASNATIGLIMAGGAILNHGMAHSLQMESHCTHGVSCSIMLPHVMEFNVFVNPTKYARIAELMGEKIEGLPLRDAAQKAVEAVRKLTLDIGMPQRLRDIGVKKEDISRFVDILFTVNIRQVNNNPRDCSREDATRIFEAAW